MPEVHPKRWSAKQKCTISDLSLPPDLESFPYNFFTLNSARVSTMYTPHFTNLRILSRLLFKKAGRKSCETKKHARKERTKAIYKLCHQKSFIISFWEVFLRNRHGEWGDKDEETSLKSKRRQFLADSEWDSSKQTGYVRGKFCESDCNLQRELMNSQYGSESSFWSD